MQKRKHKPFESMSKSERLIYDLSTGLSKVMIKRKKWKSRYYKQRYQIKQYKQDFKAIQGLVDTAYNADNISVIEECLLQIGDIVKGVIK